MLWITGNFTHFKNTFYGFLMKEEDEEDAERREAEYANGQNKSSLVKMDKENEANIV